MSSPLALRSTALLTLVLGLGGTSTARAQERADWTVIVLLSAEYETMREKLGWSGASPDVNVVVLHDQDGIGLSAYRYLGNTDTTEAPGQCCDSGGACCDSVDINLGALGISTSSAIYSDGVLDKFLTHVAQAYPARHYLVTARGQMDGAQILMHNGGGGGLTITEFRDLLGRFNQVNGAGKVDVVNIGLCLGGVSDWAYALAPVAHYYVASPNFTNSPVSIRWRIYRWTRALIQNPAMSARELAELIPAQFAEECSTGTCSNAPAEPWTSAATDLSKMPALGNAVRGLVCELLGDFASVENTLEAAIDASSTYGWGYDATLRRPDLRDFADQVASRTSDPAIRAAAEGVAAAVDDAVVAKVHEPGYFNGRAYGLSAFLPRAGYDRWTYTSTYGPFQLETMWRALLDADHGVMQTPTITGFEITPTTVELYVGDEIELEARVTTAEYGTMCAVTVDWNRAGLTDIGILEDGQPASFRAVAPGTGSLTASYGGRTETIAITVLERPVVDPPVDEEPGTDDVVGKRTEDTLIGGCVATGGGELLAVLAIGLLAHRRRSSRG